MVGVVEGLYKSSMHAEVSGRQGGCETGGGEGVLKERDYYYDSLLGSWFMKWIAGHEGSMITA